MAQKRMFSVQITDTDKFLDMPTSTQALYFHLGMHGDDDGFVASPRKLARAAGCNDDDLRLLAAKGYIIPFSSGVVIISDWGVNNTLKNDRYHATIYSDEKATLVKSASGRWELGTSLEPCWNQSGTSLEPEHNITELNLTEQSKAESMAPPAAEPAPAPGSLLKEKSVRQKYGEYRNVLLSAGDLEKLKGEFPDWQERIERLSSYMASTGKSYKNHLATIRNWARADKQKGETHGKSAIGADQRPEVGLYL